MVSTPMKMMSSAAKHMSRIDSLKSPWHNEMVPETREKSLDSSAAQYHEPIYESIPTILSVEDQDIKAQYMKP